MQKKYVPTLIYSRDKHHLTKKEKQKKRRNLLYNLFLLVKVINNVVRSL